MGGALASAVKVAKKVGLVKEAPPKPRAAVAAVATEREKYNPNAAVAASEDGGEDGKKSMVRRRRRAATRTAMTSPRGDQSTANVSRKTLLGA
tara:strand:- start:168 stop:446 length:279 start_codon:yes stop_codon:yes gene_type:complete